MRRLSITRSSITRYSILGALAAAILPSVHAVEVRVVDGEGHSMANVLVVCDGRSKGAALTDAGGLATVADACRKVQCLRGGLVTGNAVVEGGKAVCRVTAGAVVTGELDRKLCREFTSAALLDGHQATATETATARLSADGRSCRFELKPVPAGPYLLAVSSSEKSWECVTELGPLGAGPRSMSPFWHEPSPLDVTVLGRDGKPAKGVSLRIALRLSESGGPPGSEGLRGGSGPPRGGSLPVEDLPDIPSGGHCLPYSRMIATNQKNKPAVAFEDWSTDEKGQVRLMFDPADPSMIIEVLDSDDPDTIVRRVATSGQRRGKLVIDLREE